MTPAITFFTVTVKYHESPCRLGSFDVEFISYLRKAIARKDYKSAPTVDKFVRPSMLQLVVVCMRTCVDTHDGCARLARTGACTLGDEDTLVLCPTSCGVCSWSCNDRSASCAMWAANGECDSNWSQMWDTCPMSCGLCAPLCGDVSPDCARLAHMGMCVKPHIARDACAFTCGGCTRPCRDADARCGEWAAHWECIHNRKFMLQRCRKSCGACDDRAEETVCSDTNTTMCEQWASACDKDASLRQLCPRTCGVCTWACSDKTSRCADYAAMCAASQAVRAVCPLTCGICGRRTVHFLPSGSVA